MMLEFNIESNISYYDKLINLFCKAIDVGNEGKDVDSILTANECLRAIICNGMYSFFPKKDDIRNTMKGYSREEFANLVINNVRNANRKIFNQCVKEDNGMYHVTKDDMSLLIECFVREFIADKIKINPSFQKVVEDRPEVRIAMKSAKFFSPSTGLRESIIDGSQTNLKNSSAFFQGMNAYSDVGKTRRNQEDSYYIGVHPNNSNFKIMVVADGMGGYSDGQIASNIAVKDMMTWFDSLSENEYNVSDNSKLEKIITNKIEEIHSHICDKVSNGGTTLCFAIIKKDSILIGNIGDSQGYVIKDNKPICITIPHSRPQYLGIPKELARFHQENNSIYSYLGQTIGGKVSHPIDFYNVNIKEKHKYKVIICSDGVSDCVSEKDIINTALKNKENIAENLVKLAIANTSYLKPDSLSNNAKKHYNEVEYNKVINGGKDNTTAVSTTISGKRR